MVVNQKQNTNGSDNIGDLRIFISTNRILDQINLKVTVTADYDKNYLNNSDHTLALITFEMDSFCQSVFQKNILFSFVSGYEMNCWLAILINENFYI